MELNCAFTYQFLAQEQWFMIKTYLDVIVFVVHLKLREVECLVPLGSLAALAVSFMHFPTSICQLTENIH